MAITVKTDLHDSTELTRSLTHRGRDRATRAVFVEGMADTRDQLDAAIDAIESELGSNHPDDASLPLTTVSVSYFRHDAAVGIARYRRPVSQVDLYRAASAQTTRNTGTQSLEWWRDTTSFDSDGLPNGDILFHPYDDATPVNERRPRSFSHVVGVQAIEMPTILSNHPDSGHLAKVGRLNSGPDSQFLTTGGFPARTLLFDGWTSRYIGNGQFFVVYRVLYMQEKWPIMIPPFFDGSDWVTSVEDAYDAVSFGTFPVHTVLT